MRIRDTSIFAIDLNGEGHENDMICAAFLILHYWL